jgi:hypothetical protein
MAIKWNITGKAMKMRGLMDQISTEYDGGVEQATEHLTDVKGIRGQLGEMQDDLQAAANVMGNGGEPSGATSTGSQTSTPAATPAPLITGS